MRIVFAACVETAAPLPELLHFELARDGDILSHILSHDVLLAGGRPVKYGDILTGIDAVLLLDC